MSIKPTIGRVVLYRHSDWDRSGEQSAMETYGSDIPCTALITYVWSDTCINLVVFDHRGMAHTRTLVPINEAASGAGAWAEWMPYQLGQAAKTESAEEALARAKNGGPQPGGV